jgi:hypothetical protein
MSQTVQQEMKIENAFSPRNSAQTLPTFYCFYGDLHGEGQETKVLKEFGERC